jgi:hypothetical protein
VERVVTKRKSGIGRGRGEGRVWNRKKTTVEGGITEVTDGRKRRERRNQDVVNRRGVGREALKKPQPRAVFDRSPGGEGTGKEDVQGGEGASTAEERINS